MTRLAQQTVLLSVVISCGCQSLESLVPWQSASTPNYTAEELAAFDSKPVASARAGKGGQSQPGSEGSSSSGNGIVQASYSPDSQAAPVSAQRIDQLVRSGQIIIGSGQKDPGKLAEARNYFEQALALDQRNSAAHHGMAIVADLQHDYPTAEFHYKQALSANPSDPDLLNDLGYSYVLQNRFAEASNYLNRVLQIAPQHERAKVNMALMSLKRGNRPEAQQILGSVYSPADAQATLAKLEDSLQSMQVSVMPTGQMQMPQTAMNSQPGVLAPTDNGAAQDILQRMQQERDRADAIRQQQAANAAALAQNKPPIHVYPPGIADEPPVPQMPIQQNMNGAVANYGQPQQQWANDGGIPGFPQSLNQPGIQQPGVANYSNNMPAQGTATYPNQQFQNQVPQGQYSGIQGQGMVQQFGNAAQANYPNTPPQQYQNTAQGIQQNPTNTMQPYAGQSAGIGLPNSPQSAPMAGLNAGPGALFPIGLPQVQQQPNMPPQQNFYQQPAQPANSYPMTQPGPSAYLPPGSGNPQAMMPAGNGYGQPVGQPQMQPGPQYQYNTMPASSGQMMNQNWQNPQLQNTQPQFNQQPMGQGQYQSAPAPTSNPLEAYERQLQNLDNQYNRAVQQMDGSGLGVGAMPSAQY